MPRPIPQPFHTKRIKIKEKKSITKMPQHTFKYGDPDFIDERITPYIPTIKQHWFKKLFT